jgi:hypothetical protein
VKTKQAKERSDRKQNIKIIVKNYCNKILWIRVSGNRHEDGGRHPALPDGVIKDINFPATQNFSPTILSVSFYHHPKLQLF